MSMSANNPIYNNNQKRRCLYEILNVSRNADNDQMKAAYKQQARKWHPDKNINNIEEATKRFKEINEAYEILSDKHERAWYDAHRDAILRGIDKTQIASQSHSMDEDYDPDIDLMPYFSPFIFTSFDDNDINSYYNIYHNLFQRIIELEKLSKKKTPLFGNSALSFDKLKEFYSFWEIFESRRSFQFVTKYNLNDATNRKMRKAMHKENRGLINAKRKKWEETIMKLVSFIKKRDPRWRNYKLYLEKQRQEEEQRMREYQKEIEQIMKEQRELEMKEQQIRIEKEIENEPIEIEELFECVVCDKVFKSENAFKSHESSKKHKKALDELKMQLSIENEILFGNKKDDEKGATKNDYEMALQMEREDILEIEREDIINYHLTNDGISNEDEISDKNEETVHAITDEEIIALLQEPNVDIETLIDVYPTLDEEYILNLISSDRKKPKRKRNKKNKKKNYDGGGNVDGNTNDGDGDEEFVGQFKTFKKKSDFVNKQQDKMDKFDGNEDVSDEVVKVKKKKRRRRSKANKDGQNQMSLGAQQQVMTGPIKSKCKACNQMFGSKTRLYNHLKSYPKHALKSQHQ